jgi:hypothetical protein
MMAIVKLTLLAPPLFLRLDGAQENLLKLQSQAGRINKSLSNSNRAPGPRSANNFHRQYGAQFVTRRETGGVSLAIGVLSPTLVVIRITVPLTHLSILWGTHRHYGVKGMGLGASVLQDAIARGVEASRLIGAKAFLVNALCTHPAGRPSNVSPDGRR